MTLVAQALGLPHPGLFKTTGARGSCDVVIYHPDHNMLPSQMPVEHWRLVVDLWTWKPG